MTWREWLENVGWAASRFWNTVLFGEPNDSICCRIGWNIRKGGFWSRVPMPGCFKRHFERAARWTL